MSRRLKGVPTKRNLALRFPHQVAIPIPGTGLGVRTDAIWPKVREIAGDQHAEWPQRDGVERYAVHGFKSPEHAEAFRAWLAETYPELVTG
jgi:hypothetical protein